MDLHVGIIPDGNRRYAKANDIKASKTYDIAFKNILSMLQEIFSNKIPKLHNKYIVKELTIYICSKDNLSKRSEQDVKNILKMIRKFIKHYADHSFYFKNMGIKVNIIGNYQSTKYATKLQKIVDETTNNEQYILNLAIAYDAKEHLYDTIKSSNSLQECNKELGRNIDIVIRTGYEKRTSGFFPWQTMYSEWFFLDKYFPELILEDLLNIIKEYDSRERRYGQ